MTDETSITEIPNGKHIDYSSLFIHGVKELPEVDLQQFRRQIAEKRIDERIYANEWDRLDELVNEIVELQSKYYTLVGAALREYSQQEAEHASHIAEVGGELQAAENYLQQVKSAYDTTVGEINRISEALKIILEEHTTDGLIDAVATKFSKCVPPGKAPELKEPQVRVSPVRTHEQQSEWFKKYLVVALVVLDAWLVGACFSVAFHLAAVQDFSRGIRLFTAAGLVTYVLSVFVIMGIRWLVDSLCRSIIFQEKGEKIFYGISVGLVVLCELAIVMNAYQMMNAFNQRYSSLTGWVSPLLILGASLFVTIVFYNLAAGESLERAKAQRRKEQFEKEIEESREKREQAYERAHERWEQKRDEWYAARNSAYITIAGNEDLREMYRLLKRLETLKETIAQAEAQRDAVRNKQMLPELTLSMSSVEAINRTVAGIESRAAVITRGLEGNFDPDPIIFNP